MNNNENNELEDSLDMPAPIETQQETAQKISFRTIKNDPGFLVAKGRFLENNEADRKREEKLHVKKLASAIFMALTNHGYANIRAIGPFANYNAIKAYIIATGYCISRGIDLCFTVSFDEGNIGPYRDNAHVDNVVATVYSIKGYKEWSENKGDK